MNLDKYRILSKQIEDDFISSGRSYKDVLDKVVIDVFDEIEKDNKFDIERLHDWIKNPNREKANTAFTEGDLRNLAREIEFMIFEQSRQADVSGSLPQGCFVNVYEDDDGKYISDKEHRSFEAAFESRDKISTYRETIEIRRRQ